MRIVMDIDILTERQHLGTMRKELDSSVIPTLGIEVEDTAWRNPVKILTITVSFKENYYYVALEPAHVKNADDYEEVKEMYRAHNWEVLGEKSL